MSNLAQWEKTNERYLAAALAWLRLRLAGPYKESDPGELARAGEAVEAAEQNEPPPALAILARIFGLSKFEQQILLLCAAMELDTRIPELCARAQDDPRK